MTLRLETQRLIIRSYQVSDVTGAWSFLRDPKVMYYLPEAPMTQEEVKDFIKKAIVTREFLAVELKETGQMIGHFSFSPFLGDQSYEIGWVFAQEYQGQGFAFEGATKVLDWGFRVKSIHRVIATCQPENQGSWELMEKLGMRREGFFKECVPVETGWWDEYHYAILAREWANK